MKLPPELTRPGGNDHSPKRLGAQLVKLPGLRLEQLAEDRCLHQSLDSLERCAPDWHARWHTSVQLIAQVKSH